MRLIRLNTSDGDQYLLDSRDVLGFRITRAPAHPAVEMQERHYVLAFVSGIGQIAVDHYPTRAGAQAYLDQLARELHAARDEESAALSVELSSVETADCTGDHERMLCHLVDEEGAAGVALGLLGHPDVNDPREFLRWLLDRLDDPPATDSPSPEETSR